ncbi:MAG: nitric oxide dioxygenase, partial [Halomonas sp.]|nr:nitric oxide dioxygenase [Halomonas sp.]
PDHVGRIDRELLARYLPEGEVECYFVGPQGFMSCVNRHLEALGVPEARRHFEYFGPARPLDVAA